MMQRFLLEVLVEKHGGESLFGSIKIAVLPIAKVFTMCFLGFLMASKYVNILPASGRKPLNGLVFSLLLPCLIFSQLGQAITWEKMLEWWFIPVNVVIAAISGSLIGLLVASIVHPPHPFFKFTVIQIGIAFVTMSSSSGVYVNGHGMDDISSSNQIQREAHNLPVKCYCGISARMWEAWKVGTLHPGRRFVGCCRYKDKNAYCGYFRWYDAPFTPRSREVIDRLRSELN